MYDDLADVLRKIESFMDGHTAAISADAVGTTDGYEIRAGADLLFCQAEGVQFVVLGCRERCLAFRTQLSHEALRHDEIDRIGDEERLDPHFHQARNDAHSVVRMERRQREMACVRELDGDFRGDPVAHFTHHDHVGIVAEDRAESPFKIELWIELDLTRAIDEVFDGIRDSEDVERGVHDRAQRRDEGRALPTARRAGDDDDAVGFADRLAQALFRIRAKTQIFNTYRQVRFLKNTYDDRFVLALQFFPDRRQHRHAESDRLPVDGHLREDVLGHASFETVKTFGAVLQHGGHRFRSCFSVPQPHREPSVNAKMELRDLLAARDDVYVACPHANAVDKDVLDERDQTAPADLLLDLFFKSFVFLILHLFERTGGILALGRRGARHDDLTPEVLPLARRNETDFERLIAGAFGNLIDLPARRVRRYEEQTIDVRGIDAVGYHLCVRRAVLQMWRKIFEHRPYECDAFIVDCLPRQVKRTKGVELRNFAVEIVRIDLELVGQDPRQTPRRRGGAVCHHGHCLVEHTLC